MINESQLLLSVVLLDAQHNWPLFWSTNIWELSKCNKYNNISTLKTTVNNISAATEAHLQPLNWLNHPDNSRCTKGLFVLNNRLDGGQKLVHSEPS